MRKMSFSAELLYLDIRDSKSRQTYDPPLSLPEQRTWRECITSGPRGGTAVAREKESVMGQYERKRRMDAEETLGIRMSRGESIYGRKKGEDFSFRKEARKVLGRFGRNYGGGEGSNLTGKLRVKGTLIILIFSLSKRNLFSGKSWQHRISNKLLETFGG